MTRAFLLVLISALACPMLTWSQNLQEVVKQGEQAFNRRCATGYCHGARGTPAGAPRLAARGFDQMFIRGAVSQGVPGTAMPAFAKILSPSDLIAVVAYVATLNGIADPALVFDPLSGAPMAATISKPPLSPGAARGRELFSDAVRGFGRCSTCHEADDVGTAVTTSIASVPTDASALRALVTPQVSAATLGGESMPALVVSKTTRSVLFYDLTIPPPVLRTVDPGTVKFAERSEWKHSSVIAAYNDAELASILAFLRAVIKP